MKDNYNIEVAIPESTIFFQQDGDMVNIDIIIEEPEILVRI
jgi:hypothetical protein